MCYCSTNADDTLKDLQNGSIPEDALVNSCCWRWICTVRGRFFPFVNAETWHELCQKRGYLFGRQNPRGF